MLIEIIGVRSINTDKKVEVTFKTGRKASYDPKEVIHLILSGIEEIRILKDEK